MPVTKSEAREIIKSSHEQWGRYLSALQKHPGAGMIDTSLTSSDVAVSLITAAITAWHKLDPEIAIAAVEISSATTPEGLARDLNKVIRDLRPRT